MRCSMPLTVRELTATVPLERLTGKTGSQDEGQGLECTFPGLGM